MSVRTTVTAAAAAALTLAAGLAGAQGAQAAPNGWIAAPNGLVGVPENVTIYAPGAAGQVVTIGFQVGGIALTQQTTVGTNGYGSLVFTPASAGVYTINGLGTAVSAGSAQIQVAPMPTYTVLLAQNALAQNAPNGLQVGVVAPLGTLAPTGTVTLQNASGAAVSSAVPLTGSFGASTSTAVVNFSPSQGGPTAVQAAYTPASGGQTASTSPVSTPQVNSDYSNLALRWPNTLYVGTQTVMQGVIAPNLTGGSVAFYWDGAGISGSIPTVNGVATLQWAPPAAGVHYISAAYSSSDGKYSGTSTQPVNVQGARGTDSITVDPPTMAPWSIAAPIVLPAGQSVTLVGSSKSGTPVIFSETGPCVIAGASLQALSAGVCHVVAQTPGNATLAPATQTYTVTVTGAAPTPKPKKPRR